MKVYPRVSLYALMLAAAGIPLYIHVPRFASTELQMSLATIGTLLLVIRLVDLVQDPLIGWAIDRWPRAQGLFALGAAAGLAVGFPALFNLGPGPSVAWQLLATLVLLFTAYSLGSILLYGRSTTLALRPEAAELMVLAGWREGGTLAGVVIASIAPSIFYGLGAGGQGYPAFGLLLGAIAVVTALVTRPIWQRPPLAGEPLSASGLVRSGALRLLAIALVNSLPVVQIDEGFERAWRRVGLALDRTGFTVEDRDRSQGTYFVRYVEPVTNKSEPGFFSKLFSGSKAAAQPLKYRITLKSEGEKTTVSVLNAQGTPESSANAQRIVQVIADDLK